MWSKNENIKVKSYCIWYKCKAKGHLSDGSSNSDKHNYDSTYIN